MSANPYEMYGIPRDPNLMYQDRYQPAQMPMTAAQRYGTMLGGERFGPYLGMGLGMLDPSLNERYSAVGMGRQQHKRGVRQAKNTSMLERYGDQLDDPMYESAAQFTNNALGTKTNGDTMRDLRGKAQMASQFTNAVFGEDNPLSQLLGKIDLAGGGSMSRAASGIAAGGSRLFSSSGERGLSRDEQRDIMKSIAKEAKNANGMANLGYTKGFTTGEMGEMVSEGSARGMIKVDPFSGESAGSQVAKQLGTMNEAMVKFKDVFGNPNMGVQELFKNLDAAIGPFMHNMMPEKFKKLATDVQTAASAWGIDGQTILAKMGQAGMAYQSMGLSAEAGMKIGMQGMEAGAATQNRIDAGLSAGGKDRRTSASAADVEAYIMKEGTEMLGSVVGGAESLLRDNEVPLEKMTPMLRKYYNKEDRGSPEMQKYIKSSQFNRDLGAAIGRSANEASRLAREAESNSYDEKLDPLDALASKGRNQMTDIWGKGTWRKDHKKYMRDNAAKIEAEQYRLTTEEGLSGRDMTSKLAEFISKDSGINMPVGDLERVMNYEAKRRNVNVGAVFEAQSGVKEREKLREEKKITEQINEELEKEGVLQTLSRGGIEGMQVLAGEAAKGGGISIEDAMSALEGKAPKGFMEKVLASEGVTSLVDKAAAAEESLGRVNEHKKIGEELKTTDEAIARFEKSGDTYQVENLKKRRAELVQKQEAVGLTADDTKNAQRNTGYVKLSKSAFDKFMPESVGKSVDKTIDMFDYMDESAKDEQMALLTTKLESGKATEADLEKYRGMVQGKALDFMDLKEEGGPTGKFGNQDFLVDSMTEDNARDFSRHITGNMVQAHDLAGQVDLKDKDAAKKLLEIGGMAKTALERGATFKNDKAVSRTLALRQLQRGGTFADLKKADEDAKSGKTKDKLKAFDATEEDEMNAATRMLRGGAKLTEQEKLHRWTHEDKKRYDELEAKEKSGEFASNQSVYDNLKEAYAKQEEQSAKDKAFLEEDEKKWRDAGGEGVYLPSSEEALAAHERESTKAFSSAPQLQGGEEMAEWNRMKEKKKFLLKDADINPKYGGFIKEKAEQDYLEKNFGTDEQAVRASNAWDRETRDVSRNEQIKAMNQRIMPSQDPNMAKTDPGKAQKEQGSKGGGGRIEGDATILTSQNGRGVQHAKITVEMRD